MRIALLAVVLTACASSHGGKKDAAGIGVGVANPGTSTTTGSSAGTATTSSTASSTATSTGTSSDLTADEALAFLKDPSNWTNGITNQPGFGPTSGPDLLNASCLSWQFSGSHADALNLFNLAVVDPSGQEHTGYSYIYVCSSALGVYKLVARPTASGDRVTLSTATKDDSSLLASILTGTDFVFSYGLTKKCVGFSQTTIPDSDSYCVSWEYNGSFQAWFAFQLEKPDGTVVSTGNYAHVCGDNSPSYSLYAVDQATKATHLLHTVQRVPAAQVVDHCTAPASASTGTGTGTGSSSTTYQVTYSYEVGETYPDYYCQTAGQQSFKTQTTTLTIDKSTFDSLASKSTCSQSPTAANTLLCQYDANCTTTTDYCERGNIYQNNYYSGNWTHTVCTNPSTFN